jgi:hypothetical protein
MSDFEILEHIRRLRLLAVTFDYWPEYLLLCELENEICEHRIVYH